MRSAEPRDLDRVTALWIALTDYHASLDPLYALRAGSEGEVRRIVGAQLRDPDCACFVKEAGRLLSGFCIVRVDRAPPIQAERCRAELTDVFVTEAARRAGVATELVDAAVAWARERGAERLEVRVAAANATGRAFWQSSGFGSFMDVLHRRL